MLDKIKTRLDIAISNLDIENIEELFPIILDDLEYILEGLAVDEKRLTSTERFMNGVNIAEKELAYFSKLATVYFKKIYNEELEIINSSDYSLALAGGGYSIETGKIYYSYMGAMLSKKSELSFLHTCLHEGRHKMQHEAYTTEYISDFPPYMLRLLKESLLEESLQEDNRKFYLDNYQKLFTENDSEVFANEELENFIGKLLSLYLQKTNKTEKDIDNNLMYKLSKIKYLFNFELQKEKFNINEDVANQIYNAAIIRGDYKVNNQEVDRLIFTDKFIKSHPELQEEYPILRLLFNGNTPKTHKEIIKDLMRIKEGRTLEEKELIDALYDEIIATDPILLLTELLLSGNMKAVEVFMNTYPSVVIEYKDEIEKLNEQYNFLNRYMK